ncbi:MAG TPA: 3-dehydroquinate synthase family protein [Candidatus Baltobacteraceae bacterium]
MIDSTLVNDDLGYPIVVGESIRASLREFVRDAPIDRCIVLCDANLASYARALTRGLPGRIAVLAFPLGEKRKRLSTLEDVLDALVRAGADRTTTIVGVGGGVASDLFGFAAAVYMRGVPYLHVATSLVAMVDAAIGGKNGVDLVAGKNLAGTFADPLAVFADVGALRTLPYRNLREGLAEVVKHGVIEGHDLFEALEVLAPHPFHKWPWETLVYDAIKVKTMVVSDDRTERGARETLNLGHTFGHAIERASAYRVTHGAGVAIGLRAAGLLAMRLGRYGEDDHLRVLALLALLNLPMRTRELPDDVFAAMSSDKKRRNGTLRFVVPNAIGDVEYGVLAPPATVRGVLARCTQLPGAREFH